MPIVQAYQCPRTGDVFLDKELYLCHLRSLAKANLLNKKQAYLRRRMARVLASIRKAKTIPQLEMWILNHSEYFYLNAKERGLFDWDKKPGPRPGLGKIHRIKFKNMKYSDSCSCSHSAPLNKPTNWESHDDKPLGYPGWKGRIEFNADDRRGMFPTDLFKGTGINTGSGGGNEYAVTLFAADWPGLRQTALRAKLGGGTSNDIYELAMRQVEVDE